MNLYNVKFLANSQTGLKERTRKVRARDEDEAVVRVQNAALYKWYALISVTPITNQTGSPS